MQSKYNKVISPGIYIIYWPRSCVQGNCSLMFTQNFCSMEHKEMYVRTEQGRWNSYSAVCYSTKALEDLYRGILGLYPNIQPLRSVFTRSQPIFSRLHRWKHGKGHFLPFALSCRLFFLISTCAHTNGHVDHPFCQRFAILASVLGGCTRNKDL